MDSVAVAPLPTGSLNLFDFDGAYMFTKNDLEKISLAVVEAEKKTSGQILPMYVLASGSYAWTHWLWGLVGILVSSLAFYIVQERSPWPEPWHYIFLWQLTGGLLFVAASSFPSIIRFTVPKKWMHSEVHKATFANFLSAGLHKVKEKNAVLIFLSILERKVFILADEGIHSRVPENYWQEQVDEIVEGIKNKKTTEALTQAILEIGGKMTALFPQASDEVNSLPDQLQKGKDF